MAIQKQLPTEFGDDDYATYWNIGESHEDFRANNIRVVLFGYGNNAARVALKAPKGAIQVVLTGPAYSAGMNRQAMYAEIKKDPKFSDGVDV